MIKESFLLFISAIVWNSLLLRCGIEDAFLFKKLIEKRKVIMRFLVVARVSVYYSPIVR